MDITARHVPRWLDLHGAVNMRDLAGLGTPHGPVRAGRLIRADNLQDLTGEDVARLQALGVSDVIDLRSTTELAATGPGPLRQVPMVTHHHHSLLVDWDQAATAADALASTDEAAQPGPAPTGDAPADDVQAEATERAAHYWDYLRNRPDSITAALQVIASSRGATIVHCAAGKDRTGVVAALALEVAGVQSADIVADYVASAQRIGPILRRLQASEFYAADPHTYDVRAQTPTEASMQLFLGTLSRHGGARNWLCDHGWTQSELSALQAKLVG